MRRRATVGLVQRAVLRDGGRNSSEILVIFASVWLVPATPETRPPRQAATTVVCNRARA